MAAATLFLEMDFNLYSTVPPTKIPEIRARLSGRDGPRRIASTAPLGRGSVQDFHALCRRLGDMGNSPEIVVGLLLAFKRPRTRTESEDKTSLCWVVRPRG